jgi:hypothetical protein
MSITTWGWGSQAITSCGWGAFYIKEIVLPTLITEYLSDKYIYSCVIARDYVEIKTRDEDEVLLRVKPDSLSLRSWDILLNRLKSDINLRSKGISQVVDSRQRSYMEVRSRDKGEILWRVKPDSIPLRVRNVLLDRSKDEIDLRNAC